MRRIIFTTLLLAGMTPSAFAACTSEQLQAKSIQLSDLVKAIVARHPEQEKSWQQRQIDVDRTAEATTNLDLICAAYDKAIADAKAAN